MMNQIFSDKSNFSDKNKIYIIFENCFSIHWAQKHNFHKENKIFQWPKRGTCTRNYFQNYPPAGLGARTVGHSDHNFIYGAL